MVGVPLPCSRFVGLFFFSTGVQGPSQDSNLFFLLWKNRGRNCALSHEDKLIIETIVFSCCFKFGANQNLMEHLVHNCFILWILYLHVLVFASYICIYMYIYVYIYMHHPISSKQLRVLGQHPQILHFAERVLKGFKHMSMFYYRKIFPATQSQPRRSMGTIIFTDILP